MKNKLYVFGDSFATPNSPHLEQGFETYITQLERHYEIQNYAVRGIGLSETIGRLLSVLDNGIHPDSYLLITLPDCFRLKTNFFQPEEQVYTKLLQSEESLKIYSKELWHQFRKYVPFIKNMHEYYLSKELDYEHKENIKGLATIKTLSEHFKKTIVFPVTYSEKTLKKLDNNLITNNNKFCFVNKNLVDLSKNEYKKYFNLPIGKDYRQNHFSSSNHNEMFIFILNYFQKNVVKELKLRQNFLT
jgi:hypothetical protein